ncbi:angiopoietin-related protein 1-like [Macrosteles quadrilineatus]|uniref:angiopoietin-related protein 1-like n=1 Tax=Macrosteles quadrilineatus TaxID=74068 RepID=UPI0023E1E1ED|nr:angiopoietin-related protein 1-like [Macrosteles quadrilineatus]XP_054274649.1 angiopoietin-related protein 1-like [Macrosteles quadrilineatus]
MRVLLCLVIVSVTVVKSAAPQSTRVVRQPPPQRPPAPAPSNAGNKTRPASTARTREQYLFNVFEVIVSTLESKLQRIENLDKAVEHLMRRVEALDSRVNDNIDKTDSIIEKLQTFDLKLFQGGTLSQVDNNLSERLVQLDQKVSNIDSKLVGLKNQLDSNFLPADDINAEASEKKPISMNVLDITKVLSSELDSLRSSTSNVDRKLQFHINLVSENLGKILSMMSDVHEAVVEPVVIQTGPPPQAFRNRTSTTPPTPTTTIIKNSKLDKLVRQMHPILSVSNKMDEVWDVVVGTKTSVDDLVPKSDELLTQTQRQERAISNIHDDLRTNTNKIIANLDMVEKRLKKQENDVVTLAQRPVPAELLLDPTIDRIVEFDQNRFQDTNDPTLTEPPPPVTFTTPTTQGQTIPTTTPSVITAAPGVVQGVPPGRGSSRNRGVIFPSVKNKPLPANNTFATDIIPNIKDVKGYSCLDLSNAGMRHSGVYYLQIRGTTYWFLKVFCEQEVAEGGWTVIQRRDDLGEPRENFNRDWADYKNGFGDPAKEFWMGNENIYMLTNNEEYVLRIELEDFEGNKRYAQYSHFKIYSEAEYYKLEIDGYEGNAGDSLNDPWYGSNNSPFSTYNRDNDRSSLNCASMLKGGWWWKSCGRGLNGLYLNDPQDITARQGIVWFRWRGWDYTLKKAMMMIKPKGSINPT